MVIEAALPFGFCLQITAAMLDLAEREGNDSPYRPRQMISKKLDLPYPLFALIIAT